MQLCGKVTNHWISISQKKFDQTSKRHTDWVARQHEGRGQLKIALKIAIRDVYLCAAGWSQWRSARRARNAGSGCISQVVCTCKGWAGLVLSVIRGGWCLPWRKICPFGAVLQWAGDILSVVQGIEICMHRPEVCPFKFVLQTVKEMVMNRKHCSLHMRGRCIQKSDMNRHFWSRSSISSQWGSILRLISIRNPQRVTDEIYSSLKEEQRSMESPSFLRESKEFWNE